MAYTEFYVQSTGDNLNAGSTTANAAAFTYAGGTFVRATGVFTVASGDPAADGVAVGDWVSIYTTAGATVANCVARVTARDATTITISATPALAVGAVSNVSETASAATAKVGGAWDGPSTTVSFPFGSVLSTGVNASGHTPRVNFKGDGDNTTVDYTVTAAMTHALAGPVIFQGYTTTEGDGGKAVIGVTATASYVILTVSGANVDMADFIFDGAVFSSGSSTGLQLSGGEQVVYRIVAREMRGLGIAATASVTLVECEAYLCNRAGSANLAGIQAGANNCLLIRCISHNNNIADVDGHGFIFTSATVAINCIADTNGGHGYLVSSTSTVSLIGCDAYNNVGSGIDFTSASAMTMFVQNCNLINNGGYGINSSGSATLRNGVISKCGFGGGTEANTSGTILGTLTGVSITDSVQYADDVLPWVDAPNGDFRINLAAAKGSGRGAFTQTQASYTGAVGYPDIGAAQHADVGGGGARSYTSGG